MNNPELWMLLRESLRKSVPCALLLTLKTEGSGPGRPGAAMAATSAGTNSGTIGILRLSPSGLEIQESELLSDHSFTSTDAEHWEYEGPLGLSNTVYIIGGGHVGRALAGLHAKLPFKPVILDERRFQPGDSLLPCKWIEVSFIDSHKYIPQGDHSWVVIMTPCHSADSAVLKSLCGINLRYIGLMASRSKKENLFKGLAEAGVSEDFLDSVHSPIGLPIGSRTPDEIAVSIAAELIALLHDKAECISI